MTLLLIRNEGTGASWRVWPDPEPARPGLVQETRSYLFELTGAEEAGAADLLIDDQPLEALRVSAADAARWRWQPGFHAGTVEAELRMPGTSPRRFEIITDPDLQKLTREDFDAMVREILEDTFALFSLSSFRRNIARGAGVKPPAIARLEFLRSRIDELEAVVSAIELRPRHVLAAEEAVLPWHRANRVTGPEILRAFRSGRVVVEQEKSSRLPAALQGYLPEHIRVKKRRSSLDITEHRQMGACLRAWATWLGAVSETLERRPAGADKEIRRELSSWANRCRQLSRRVSRLSMAALFAAAGDAQPRLVLSSLFRNNPSYRRFYRLWQDMNLGIAAVFGDFLNMPLSRTFELYELWCFLRLVRAGSEAFGPEGVKIGDLFISDASGGLTLASGAATVQVGNNWSLCFQKQYREFWKELDRQGSYSRQMTPDIVAMQEPDHSFDASMAKARLIILDAKYRIDGGLAEALTSIHTYRDALVRELSGGSIEGIVTAAYLLTPFVPPELGTGYKTTSMPGRLLHPVYRSTFRFGAVTLHPGMTLTELGEALRIIIADATAS